MTFILTRIQVTRNEGSKYAKSYNFCPFIGAFYIQSAVVTTVRLSRQILRAGVKFRISYYHVQR